MEQLITVEQLAKTGRPIGKVDEAKLKAYITETEQLHIKPALGDSLYLDLLKIGEERADYALLLNGGTYEAGIDDTRSFMGLREAIAYFVYAQNVMSGDFQSTRYGIRIKDDDYSSHISSKERSDHYSNTMEVANQYLNECITYCKTKGLIGNRKKHRGISTGGCTIRKIGK